MLAGAAEGAPFVMLDAAVVPIDLRRSEAGMALNWRVRHGDEVRDVADGVAVGLRALMPLSPVHLRAKRIEGGDIAISWTRRGRFDADSWLASDIPLDGSQERYLVEIGDGVSTVRSIETERPEAIYPLSDQQSDFGQVPEEILVRVRQFGERVALGLPVESGFQLPSSTI